MKIQPIKKVTVRKPAQNSVAVTHQQISKPDFDPGHTLGVVGFVLAFVGLGIIGLVLSIIGFNKSKEVGIKNGLAYAGIWLNSISIVVFSLILVAITITSYVGVTARANTATSQSNALTVQQYAEVYYAENTKYPARMADFTIGTIPSMDMPSNISLLNTGTTRLDKSNGLTTIWYQYAGDANAPTGGRIMYWDYTDGKVSTNVTYVGDATSGSSFKDLQ
jgi:hypothetical protein